MSTNTNSLVKLNGAVQGAIFPEASDREIFVGGKDQDGKPVKAKVLMTGAITSVEKPNADGKYVAERYGRLPVEAAAAGEGEKKRLVLQIAGGLRAVLFATTDADKAEFRKRVGKDDAEAPDYNGSIELGDGTEAYLDGYRRKSADGKSFISLRSGKVKEAKNGNGNSAATHSAPPPATADDDLPF